MRHEHVELCTLGDCSAWLDIGDLEVILACHFSLEVA